MTLRHVVASLLMASATIACSDAGGVEEDGRIALPRALAEVSGLAAASDSSVFAHDDEVAIIHELRVSDGESLREFCLGMPAVRGDFEGVAKVDDRIFLVTSDGLIYAATIGADRAAVDYKVHDSGIGERCEVEGLSRAPSQDHLLVLCKEMHRKKDRDRLTIYRWKIGGENAETEPWLSLRLRDMMKKSEARKFKPSALEWDPERNRMLIASARSRHLLILSETGALIEKRKLDKKLHPQAEGLTILADRWMVLADEKARARSAYLTVYPEAQP